MTAVQWPALGEEHPQDFWYGPDELTVGQGEQQVPAEILAEQEGPFLGAGGAEAA
jgi:hypothetical protein